MNTVKLTKKTAYELISRISTGRNIKKDDTPPDVAIYRASTGPAGLTITCENDWFDHSGLIKLTISDGVGANTILMYFSPATLERDFVAEDAEKEWIERERRVNWVSRVGKEQAHKLIESYGEG